MRNEWSDRGKQSTKQLFATRLTADYTANVVSLRGETIAENTRRSAIFLQPSDKDDAVEDRWKQNCWAGNYGKRVHGVAVQVVKVRDSNSAIFLKVSIDLRG